MAVKTASQMTYIVSSGVLNSTPTNQYEVFLTIMRYTNPPTHSLTHCMSPVRET